MIDYVENYSNARTKAKIKIAQDTGQMNDFLIFGDSSADGGINANRLEEETGLNSFNFALGGSALVVGNYYILEDYLSRNDAPKYIILMTVYDIWYRGLNTDGVIQTLIISFPGKLIKDFMLSPIVYNPRGNVMGIFGNVLLPSQRYKWEIRGIIKSMNIVGYFRKRESKEDELMEEIVSNNGSSLYDVFNENLIIDDINYHKEFVETNKFEVSWINQFYLDKFLKLAKEKDIKVFLVYSPVEEEFYSEEVNSDYIKSYKKFIEDITGTYDNVVLLTDDFYVVSVDKLTTSIDHLNYKESEVFTGLIAKDFKEYLDKNTN